MPKKIVLVTGASAGIGKAVALEFSKDKATVLMTARSRERGEQARQDIIAQSGSADVHLLIADLSLQASVRQLADQIHAQFPRLDVLINCAAVYKSSREVTSEGFETMFATNHLAYFLLTRLLLDLLHTSEQGRIINVTAPSTTPINFDDLQSEHRFNPLTVFGATKMANLLFTFALARRLENTPVTVSAVHPGLVRSNIMREANFFVRLLTNLMSRSAENAAQSIASLALQPAAVGQNGKFFHNGREVQASSFAQDRTAQERLWEISQKLTGMHDS